LTAPNRGAKSLFYKGHIKLIDFRIDKNLVVEYDTDILDKKGWSAFFTAGVSVMQENNS